MCGETRIPIGIRVRGNNKLGATRIPTTAVTITCNVIVCHSVTRVIAWLYKTLHAGLLAT